MSPEAQNGFKALLHLMNAAETEDAKCDVLRSFTDGCVQSALASRTEQCVSICDYIEKEAASLILNPDLDEGSKQYEKGKELCAARIRAKIRTLNQSENKS